MDISPQDNTTQPISDDQDLAKALAGVSLEEPAPDVPTTDEAPVTPLPPVESLADQPASSLPTPSTPPVAPLPGASGPAAVAGIAPAGTGASDLDGIKLDVLKELRPLMDKVDLPADEKFDTYLMLIRSTDDTSLIAPAHAAAQNITDEKRKAEALLEVIKEIDYLSKKGQSSAS